LNYYLNMENYKLLLCASSRNGREENNKQENLQKSNFDSS